MLLYHCNGLCYQWGANSNLAPIFANPVIALIIPIFRFELNRNQIKSNHRFYKLEPDFTVSYYDSLNASALPLSVMRM